MYLFAGICFFIFKFYDRCCNTAFGCTHFKSLCGVSRWLNPTTCLQTFVYKQHEIFKTFSVSKVLGLTVQHSLEGSWARVTKCTIPYDTTLWLSYRIPKREFWVRNLILNSDNTERDTRFQLKMEFDVWYYCTKSAGEKSSFSIQQKWKIDKVVSKSRAW